MGQRNRPEIPYTESRFCLFSDFFPRVPIRRCRLARQNQQGTQKFLFAFWHLPSVSKKRETALSTNRNAAAAQSEHARATISKVSGRRSGRGPTSRRRVGTRIRTDSSARHPPAPDRPPAAARFRYHGHRAVHPWRLLPPRRGRPISLGAKGTAVTMLRPSGKGRFGDQLVDVVTAGEFISAETPIIVSQIDGMRVLVSRRQISS